VATLADLRPGDQFLFATKVTSVDATGMGLALYGPGRVQAATAVIAPDGTMTGSLAAPPGQVPVTVVTGFTPVSAGDIMENGQTGETAVVRWSQIQADGTVLWSSSAAHRVVYPAAGWTVISHVDGL
jgi:hypothetical protein